MRLFLWFSNTMIASLARFRTIEYNTLFSPRKRTVLTAGNRDLSSWKHKDWKVRAWREMIISVECEGYLNRYILVRNVIAYDNPDSFSKQDIQGHMHSVWKSSKMSHLNFWILAFSSNFWPFKTGLSGNSVWPQKLAKMYNFWYF